MHYTCHKFSWWAWFSSWGLPLMGNASSLTWLDMVVLSTDSTVGLTPTEIFCSVSEKDVWHQVVPGASL